MAGADWMQFLLSMVSADLEPLQNWRTFLKCLVQGYLETVLFSSFSQTIIKIDKMKSTSTVIKIERRYYFSFL